MSIYAIYSLTMIALGLWYLLLVTLSFIAWRHVRHWSALLIFISMVLMTLLQGTEAISTYLLQAAVPGIGIIAPGDLIEIISLLSYINIIGRLFGCIVGIVGGVGALVALRRRWWKIQALRYPLEAAQPEKGSA